MHIKNPSQPILEILIYIYSIIACITLVDFIKGKSLFHIDPTLENIR